MREAIEAIQGLLDDPDDEQLRDRVRELERENEERQRDWLRATNDRDDARQEVAAQRNRAEHAEAERDALRDRVAELERELQTVSRDRYEAERSSQELHGQRDFARREAYRLVDERDEARREAEAARARSNADRNATNKACRERDAARREAAELREHIREMTGVQRELARHANAYQRELLEVRRENERLRAAASAVVRSRFDVDREYRNQQMEALRLTIARTTPPAEIADQPARCPLTCPHGDRCALEHGHDGGCNHRGCDCNEPNQPARSGIPGCSNHWHPIESMPLRGDQPAPQTHYREGDLVLSTDGPVRLVRLVRIQTARLGEVWRCDSREGTVYVHPDLNPILERDGTPTDEGLRRLAERAGYSYTRSDIYGEDCLLICIGTREVVHHGHPDARQKSEAAAALREMGGA